MTILERGKLSIKVLSDFLLPRFCVSCSIKLTTSENILCSGCFQKIKRADEERLRREFNRKFNKNQTISDFFSLYIFEKDLELQHAIHALKYNKNFTVGKFLGEELASGILSKKPDWHFDLIIPVPLHQLKKAERGYNQSYYIAKGLRRRINKPINTHSIRRIRFTESQTSMNLVEREENIYDAFKVINLKSIEDKNILLVDDVITTGATISECGRVLLEAGAKKIYAASIAIAD